ncbi:MAG: hypothetical protein NVS2B2_38960 [Ktedonobacteraceae bacterium]
MQQASKIYQAESALQAKDRFAIWMQGWGERAPKAVAILEREFAHTLVYYELDVVAREWIRTTSLLERTNRELRRKFRLAVTFGSQVGAEVAVYLQVQRLHARWMDVSWWQVSSDLPFALRKLHP